MLGITMTIAVNATNYFVDTTKGSSGTGDSWETAFKTLAEAETAVGSVTGDNIYIKGDVTIPSITGTSSMWTLAARNYYFSCDPSNTGTSTVRTMKDNNVNGITEPWEFKYPTIFLSTYAGTGSAVNLVASTTLDGLTITQTTTSTRSVNAAGSVCNSPAGGIIQNCVFTGSNLFYPGMSSNNPGGLVIKTSGTLLNSLIEKNTLTITVTTTGSTDLKIYPILDAFVNGNTPQTITVSGCVFRNNKATLDYSGSTSNACSNLRGMVLNISDGGTSNTAGSKSTVTISDCLIYNNEIAFTGNATFPTPPNACIATHISYSGSNTTNNWINNTFANNKSTNLKGACMALNANGKTPDFVINNAYNNVFWNNQNTISSTSVTSNVSVSSGSAQNPGSVFANNVMDVLTSGNWGTNLIYVNNLTDLSKTNTTATTGPQFRKISSNVGYIVDGSVELADWRLNSGSYLYRKGIDFPTVATDKAGKAFGNPRSVGAYEGLSTPTITSVTAGNAQISVAFTAGSDGGSAITNYKYSTDGGANFIACSPAKTTSPVLITGLTNGTGYNVQIRATNAYGDGAPTATVAATPSADATTPSAPTINSIASGNAQLSVAFSVGSDGGSAITDYQYSTDGTNWVTRAGTANPIIITGLTNGTTYPVIIRAVNANGNGASSASISAIPSSVPGAPTNVVATPGTNITAATANTAQASVSFTAPVSNGGSPIVGYVVTSSPGAISIGGNASPIVVPGLASNTAYTFTVTAINALGTSIASTPSSSVSTLALDATTLLTAPVNNTPTVTNGQVSLAFTAPTNNKTGQTISNYQYSTDGGLNWTTPSTPVTSSPIVITGLTNGSTYNITLKAITSSFSSIAGTASAVAISNVPTAPIINNVSPGNGSLSVVFLAPSATYGSTISNYLYSTDGGINWTTRTPTATTSPLSISGLTNGNSYNIQIKAVSNNGNGAVSNTITAMPSTTPAAPSISGITTGDGTLVVAFISGSSNGSTLIDYKYSTDGGTSFISAKTTSSPLVISTLSTDGTTALINGTSYNIQIKAVNANGEGAATASTAATPNQTVTAVSSAQATATQRIVTTTTNGIISETTSAIRVYSVTGKLVQSINAVAGQKIQLQPGIYIVKANTEKGNLVQKIVL